MNKQRLQAVYDANVGVPKSAFDMRFLESPCGISFRSIWGLALAKPSICLVRAANQSLWGWPSSRDSLKGNMTNFAHSGDLGDIIYSLPAIKAKGGGHLTLFPAPGRTREIMTESRANVIIPLLLCQPYIHSCKFGTGPDSALNGFRDHWNAGNLADMHLATQGLDWRLREEAWLTVGEPGAISEFPVVFSRSERYPGNVNWAEAVRKYGRKAVFLGTRDEHRIFWHKYGPVAYRSTSSLLEAARIIGGSQMFIGNQSCLAAIAEGLKVRMILEVGNPANCCFDRFNRINAWNDRYTLPDVS